MESRDMIRERTHVFEPGSAQQRTGISIAVANPVRGMRIGADGDNLPAQLCVPLHDIQIRHEEAQRGFGRGIDFFGRGS